MKKVLSIFAVNYLKFLTYLYVRIHKIEIIGLTGSVGKTTLTLAVHAVLSCKFKTGMTYQDGHGLNSETGVPFSILGISVDGYSPLDWARYLIAATWNFFFRKFPYEKFVVEMGVDKPDDMKFLLSMIRPNVGVFLSIAKVHTANFESLAKKSQDAVSLIFEEKSELIKTLSENSWAILNNDEKQIRNLANITEANVCTFGLKNGSDVRGKLKEVSAEKFMGNVSFPGAVFGKALKKTESVDLEICRYMVNEHVFSTLLGAIAVGAVYGISLKSAVKALENLQFPAGRMSKIKGIKNTLIIDSSYNASKLSVIEALNNLSLFKNRKKIAVLGDMRELGEAARLEHEAIAEKAAAIADEFVLIGPLMKKLLKTKALQLGFDKEKIHCFANTWDALDFIKNTLVKGKEAILVKGSQNTLFLEIIVEGLMQDKSAASRLLCRRGKFWEARRQEMRE